MLNAKQNIRELLNINFPIIQAPMAGADSVQLASAVAEAGGLGSFACALLTPSEIKQAWSSIRSATTKPVNLNFFCHNLREPDESEQRVWRRHLEKFYSQLNIDPDEVSEAPLRMPFDEAMCDVVEETKPEVVSFHFGLPNKSLLSRVKSTGAKVISTATTLDEALWLEMMKCDAIIAQGIEAGGHRGMFLTEDITTQTSTTSLVRALSTSVSTPIIASGGISDAEAIEDAIKAGASAVQIGTAYLFCPEARVSHLYLSALNSPAKKETALTNIYSGRPARGIMSRLMREIGPISEYAPAFPYASRFVTPLQQKAEKNGSIDFSQMWAGKSYWKGKIMPAADLTRQFGEDALTCLD
jgi:nitronate monooxygenase